MRVCLLFPGRNAPQFSLNFNTFLCYFKLTHSCRVSEQPEGKRERQVMPPLVLLIKFVILWIIFQVSFSFYLLVANWRLSLEFWSPSIFSTSHGDQNGRSLECCKHGSSTLPPGGQTTCNWIKKILNEAI